MLMVMLPYVACCAYGNEAWLVKYKITRHIDAVANHHDYYGRKMFETIDAFKLFDRREAALGWINQTMPEPVTLFKATEEYMQVGYRQVWGGGFYMEQEYYICLDPKEECKKYIRPV